MIDTNVIESALIDKCIELYLGVLSEREEIEARKTDNRIDYGIPPRYMFLREYDAVKKTEHFYKSYGPRYGRGYSYDIRLEGNKIILENEDVLWVS